jgi:hypothetical protein
MKGGSGAIVLLTFILVLIGSSAVGLVPLPKNMLMSSNTDGSHFTLYSRVYL